MTPEEAALAMSTTLARQGLAERALAISGTIPRAPGAKGTAASLPNISMDSGATASGADLIAQGELGRGGMGVVHLAQQRSLNREVAVKTVRSSQDASGRALVREAQIMGSLEHPNLVPVHALGVDTDGVPLLVMKRVEGASWRALLSDPQHEGWKPLLAGHGEPLRANVEILSQLCRALAFAHDRGVVHRDLKPENVMIGRYGEVYLVDWGVALHLAERETEAPTIVGTPAYLAPEMARADPRLVDARTDVYLLGGLLFEVLTGRVPHEAPTALAALILALAGEVPVFPAEVPPELADLSRHAMAVAPQDRVSSAEAFREGLTRFLASREVERAVAEARLTLARARQLIAREGPASLDAFRALIEARLIFVSACRSRPRDETLCADLDGSIVHLVERELGLRSPIGARALLGELSTPSPRLTARVEALEAELTRERSAAEAHLKARAEADLSPGFRSITVMAGLSALIVMGITWGAWRSETAEELAKPGVLAVCAALVGATLVALFVQRRVLLANEGLRRHSGFFVMLALNLVFIPGVSILLGGTASETVTLSFASYACMWAVYAVNVRDVWPNVVVYLVATGLALASPRLAQPLGVLVTGLMFGIWWRAVRLHTQRSTERS